jgi:hypothetical protein
MSLSNFNTGIPQGTQEQSCTPGSAVGGLDSNNIFRILKVNADGTLPMSSNVPVTGFPSSGFPLSTLNPTSSIKPAGLVVFNALVTPTSITNGVFKIDPFLSCDSVTLGAFNFMLYRTGFTSLATAVGSLSPFVDSISFTQDDLANGFGGFWHQIPQQNMIGTTTITVSNNSNKEIGLTTGQYNLIIWVHTAMNMNSGDVIVGFNEFSKISS